MQHAAKAKSFLFPVKNYEKIFLIKNISGLVALEMDLLQVSLLSSQDIEQKQDLLQVSLLSSQDIEQKQGEITGGERDL